jgi:hypothetical protein
MGIYSYVFIQLEQPPSLTLRINLTSYTEQPSSPKHEDILIQLAQPPSPNMRIYSSSYTEQALPLNHEDRFTSYNGATSLSYALGYIHSAT